MIVRLRVAGLTLRARADRDAAGASASPRGSRPFTATRGGGHRASTCARRRRPRRLPGARLFDSGGLWSVHRHGGRLLYLFREPLAGTPALQGAC